MIKNRKELIEFEKRLLKVKKKLLKQRNFTNGMLLNQQGESAGELSAYRTHVADIGSETYQKEISSQLSSYESDVLMQIDEALKRIRNNCYGDCIKCSKPIAKARLKALPYTQICVKCTKEKTTQKKNK
jgi:RNA polymerase-binding transcription factor DksA